MNYKDLADLIYPDVKEIEYYEEKYPERKLDEGAMVVRFAPSPTGFVHIGGLMQCVIDRKLADQTNGVFILRIEDTDQKREIENGVNQIVSAVKDFNIEFDEGMINETESKGEYGPYKQSERGEIYRAYAKYLIEQGRAYPCFATPEGLEEMRAKQEAAKLRTGYYGVWAKYRNLSVDEAIEKIRLGMYIMIREATGARDLEPLIPVLKKYNTRKCVFVTDDRHPKHLKKHISGMVKKSVELGVDPIKAIQMASLNTAEYFKIPNTGAIAPGYNADILVFDDLKTFDPKMVFKKGKLVAKNGQMTIDMTEFKPPELRGSVNIKPLKKKDFQIKIQKNKNKIKVINVIPKQLITKLSIEEVKNENGYAVSDTTNDILKIAVIERHKATGNIGLGFVKGFGLKSGAIASTIAHDSHNMIIIGTNDEDMYYAANQLVKSQGGKIIVENGKTLSQLELPIAGLISNKPAEEVMAKLQELEQTAADIGCKINDPFMSMAFLSLSVIPEIKITDKGLIDVSKFKVTNLFV